MKRVMVDTTIATAMMVKPKSFKLDDESARLLDLLAKRNAISRTEEMKQIIRRAAKADRITADMTDDEAVRVGLDARAQRDGLKPKADQL